MDKTRSKSRSMEEISRISKSGSNDLTRSQVSRHSLPNQTPGKRRVIHPEILDVNTIDEEEDDDSVIIEIGKETDNAKQSVRGSQLSKKSQRSERSHRSRTESSSSRTRKESIGSSRPRREYAAYDNRAYDNNLDGISVISRTSTRASSIQEVQREQYCCFTKWSPLERKLAALAVILVTIIIILSVTVAILVTGNKTDDT